MNTTTVPEIPAGQVPDGWTNDPDDLEGWCTPGSGEEYMARCHGIENCTIILRRKNESGELEYIFMSKGRYYWGEHMVDHVFEITKPKTLSGILGALGKDGSERLKMKKLPRVGWVKEEPEEQEQKQQQTVKRRLYVPISSDSPASFGQNE